MILFREIHDEAIHAAQRFKRSEADLISILQKVDETKTHYEFGYTSLFQYVVQALELSESLAYNFIAVARKATECPALKVAIDQGDLSVSKARKLAPVLTFENQDFWIKKAVELPQRRLEEEVAKVAPFAAFPDRIKIVGEDIYELRAGVSKSFEQKLKRVQDLESQRTGRVVRLAEVLEAALNAYLEKRDPIKKAERILFKKEVGKVLKTNAVTRSKPVARQVNGRKTDSVIEPRLKQDSIAQLRYRPIPTRIKHRVTLRDQGQCTHKTDDGKRCESKRWLDIHHIVPRSQGGSNAIENLRTLCSSHHRMHHKSEDLKSNPLVRVKDAS